MELYEYARPALMAGKKILYLHGFASSGATGSVGTLRLLMPECQVIAPDLPVEPSDVMNMLTALVASEKPDLVIGTSMGGMYAEMLYGIDRILVNPAFQLADTILKNNGLGKQEFHNPRKDGQTSFLVTKGLIESFREVSSHCFEKAPEDSARVYGLFGIHDDLVHTFDLFSRHYPQAIRFDGEHHLNDDAILHSLLPVVQWIDDRQRGVSRRVIVIALGDKIVNHSSGFRKAVEILSQSYDIHIQASVPYNHPSGISDAANRDDRKPWDSMGCADIFSWCERELGVPVWNRVTITNHKELLLADYLIDGEPGVNGGCPTDDSPAGFMGTLIEYGSDAFKSWEDIIAYFSRLGGQ
ncbi:MAG: esterase [Bacteroidales bacterium]|jgi:hypothetical protein|nr:esterase [Bacteroidales bacterium]MCI2134700.1 esterase [Bacteroidales bacterium]